MLSSRLDVAADTTSTPSSRALNIVGQPPSFRDVCTTRFALTSRWRRHAPGMRQSTEEWALIATIANNRSDLLEACSTLLRF
ncbi:hypothetical protein MVEN_00152500 [Mycena venus]|uniref:Uncharacterized protein n=1 Tax=Mycena venus TaxID=2733690 RepID=A0A8H6YZZ5_9AGAR|nr:hypothetical protein MVEN_00152500 [Mycena venus]